MGSLDSTFCYSIFVWYLLLASLFLLHIATLYGIFQCSRTSHLGMEDFVANGRHVTVYQERGSRRCDKGQNTLSCFGAPFHLVFETCYTVSVLY
jgi:hypothetical protein